MKKNGLNVVELRDNRYDQIIHMVSAACGAEDFYTTDVKASIKTLSLCLIICLMLNVCYRIIRPGVKTWLLLKV
jgi:hypothetical protein